MDSSNDGASLLCLFHHDDEARTAVEDLIGSGIPDASIVVIGGSTAISDTGSKVGRPSALEALGLPDHDLRHLRQAVEDGGTIVVVSAISAQVDTVERIFARHQATKMDEADAGRDAAGAAPQPVATGARAGAAGMRSETETAAAGGAAGAVIPVVEEKLEVGRRSVDRGGVRVYRRVIEMPAEGSINLREQRVVIERTPVDRAATQADLDAQGRRLIELTETTEEVVISKHARVVEEVVVGRESEEHTQHIQETVRRTEVEVEELSAEISGSQRRAL